jgi:hypothetical protein
MFLADDVIIEGNMLILLSTLLNVLFTSSAAR